MDIDRAANRGGAASPGRAFDEHHQTVIGAIGDSIERAHSRGAAVGFCGQAPSDAPTVARLLVEAGIDSGVPSCLAEGRFPISAIQSASCSGPRSGRGNVHNGD